MEAIVFGKDSDLVEEVHYGTLERVSLGSYLGGVNRVQGQGIDSLARARAEDDTNPGYDIVRSETQKLISMDKLNLHWKL